MNQYVIVTKRAPMLICLAVGLLTLWGLCDALFLHRVFKTAGDPVGTTLLLLFFGTMTLLFVPNSIKMLIRPRTYMVADAAGVALHAYRRLTAINRDSDGRIRITREKNPSTMFDWSKVISFSEDRSTLGRDSTPGKPAPKSRCLRIRIDPSVDLDGFTCKGVIGADPAFDVSTLSRRAHSRLTAEELEQYKYAQCCITARFLPGGIDHAIQVLQEMKDAYTEI